MHYLVTGGAGFIGSHLVESLLSDGHQITVLDDLSTGKRENLPDGVTFIEGDITTPSIFDELVQAVDGCFHLAAIASVQRGRDEWLRAHQVNLGGTVALFDAIMRAKKMIPVVYASSAAVYGSCPDIPSGETSKCQPLSAYGVDKLTCELQARIANEQFGIATIGLRFFNVYGPRQDPSSPYSGVISIFTKFMKQNDPITIYGDGEQSRDFIYVGDIVRALRMSLTALEDKTLRCAVLNACTGKSITINRLAETMGKIITSQSSISHDKPRDGDIRTSLGDGSLATNKLGFEAKTLLEDGLTLALETL